MTGEPKDSERKTNHLISRRKFREFMADHPSTERDREAFYGWCRYVEKADWRNFADVRATFATADQIGPVVCFNLGGNKYRVLARINFRPDNSAKVYIQDGLTHKEYDKL